MSGNFCQLTVRKARKAHRCIECRGAIQTGEAYHYLSGAWEGSGFGVKRCPECSSIHDRYIKEANLMDDEIPAFGMLADDLFESDHKGLQDEFSANKTRRGGA